MNTAAPVPAKMKVFLVDDNADTRLVLSLLLRGEGYEVHTAGTMAAALDDFPRSGSSVLLSDLGLPDGDGWQLLRRLRASGVSPYAIAMSGFGTLADVAASNDAGFRHHLVKPIDLEVLEGLLGEARREAEGV